MKFHVIPGFSLICKLGANIISLCLFTVPCVSIPHKIFIFGSAWLLTKVLLGRKALVPF